MSRSPEDMVPAREVVVERCCNDRWMNFGVAIFLLAIIGIVFGQTGRFEFIDFDDNSNVYLNHNVIMGLSPKGFLWAFTHAQVGNWIPLTTLSHMACCQLFGPKAGGHHLVNVLLHAAATVLLFLVLKNMTGALWRSAFVAAVFAIHPLRAESVAWVSERKDVLSGVFFMLTLGAYVRYARKPQSPGRYLAMLALFALGLMAKSMLVTLPGVFLLLDYWPLRRFQAASPAITRLVLEKIPMLLLSAGACAATVAANRDSIVPIEKLSLLLRISNALVAYATYIWQMFYPVGLAAFYPHPKAGLPFWEVALAFVIVISVSTLVFVYRRTRPYLLTGWLWYLGMLVPVIGLVQSGALGRADRYTYLPQIGLYILIAWGAVDLCAGWRHCRLALGTLAAAILPALMVCAHVQTAYWRDSETLWHRTLACTSDNVLAHYCLGVALASKGRKDEAVKEYEVALRIRPDSPEANYCFGIVLQDQGRTDEAISHYRIALESEPGNADAHIRLGNALLQKGRADEAILHFNAGLKTQPDNAEAHYNLGMALMQKGDVREAVIQWQKAYEIQPANSSAPNEMAWVLATCPDASIRNGGKAIELAQQANQISGGKNPGILDTLSAAYAEAGRFAEAVEAAKRAEQMAEASGDSELVNAVRSRIRLYLANSPFRDASQTQAITHEVK